MMAQDALDDADVAGMFCLSLVVGACEWARQLAAGGGVVIWAQFDGQGLTLIHVSGAYTRPLFSSS